METRILVVDTNGVIGPAMPTALEADGYLVSVTMTHAQGLRKILQQRPDVIVLAVHGRNEADWDTCRHLTQMPDSARIAVRYIAKCYQTCNIDVDSLTTLPWG